MQQLRSLYPLTFNTCNPQSSTLNPQPSTLNPQPSTSMPFRANVFAAMALSLLAAGLLVAPPRFTSPVRTTLRDATEPGQRLVVAGICKLEDRVQRFRHPDGAAERITELQRELAAAQQESRQHQLAAARARDELHQVKQVGAPPFPYETGRDLVAGDVLAASVLGGENASLWRAGRFIDRGTVDGIPESALVLDGDPPVIDRGEGEGLAAGQPVYAGRAVVGRIAHVGLWMSVVQPVTDAAYRDYVETVRSTPAGPAFGVRGILEGTGGETCRLVVVDPNADVRPGDDVYTGRRDGTLPFSMYYGRVSQAEFDARSGRWSIEVEPAVRGIEGWTVHVLRRSLNPLRMSAQ
ncbi:MAG: rod shape-determining protein MreC [Planctomycetes bacterium]|nr:rod shape-determining protein MreC [Planctomycetota bacterium]